MLARHVATKDPEDWSKLDKKKVIDIIGSSNLESGLNRDRMDRAARYLLLFLSFFENYDVLDSLFAVTASTPTYV